MAADKEFRNKGAKLEDEEPMRPHSCHQKGMITGVRTGACFRFGPLDFRMNMWVNDLPPASDKD